MYNVVMIGVNDPPGYGARCVSSNLKHNGFGVSHLFFGCGRYQVTPSISEAADDVVEAKVRELQPDLVGVSIHSIFGHTIGVRLAALISSRLDLPIVLGGVHPTMTPTLCLQQPGVEYVCMGEGEESMVDLCRRLSSGRPADDIPGIMVRGRTTYTRRNPPKDLDSLPYQGIGNDGKCTIFADGSICEGDPILKGLAPLGTRCNRGCPFGCSYCNAETLRALYDRGTAFRTRSPRHVIKELREYLVLKPSCDAIWMWDDVHPTNRAWVDEFAHLYKEHIGIPFWLAFHPNTVCEESVAALRSAGLQHAQIGIESASDETRKKVFLRPESRKQILQAHDIVHRHGVDVHYDIILEHPWESCSELQDTFELMMSMKRPFKVNMHNLMLFPGTKLAKRAVEEGLTTEDGLVQTLSGNPFDMSRKMWWVQGIPVQRDAQRAYWMFLIMAAVSEQIPRWFVRFLGNRKLLRTHPTLLTGRRVCDIGWKPRDQVVSELSDRTFWRWIFGNIPGVGKALALLLNSHKCRFALVLAHVGYRFVTRLPMAFARAITARPDSNTRAAVEANELAG